MLALEIQPASAQTKTVLSMWERCRVDLHRFLWNAQKETYMPEKSVQECKLCHCGDGLCQNPPKKEGVVLHLKHNSRKEGGENCEQTSSEPIFAIVGIYSGWGTACVQW